VGCEAEERNRQRERWGEKMPSRIERDEAHIFDATSSIVAHGFSKQLFLLFTQIACRGDISRKDKEEDSPNCGCHCSLAAEHGLRQFCTEGSRSKIFLTYRRSIAIVQYTHELSALDRIHSIRRRG
jgi:hypothetical protein